MCVPPFGEPNTPDSEPRANSRLDDDIDDEIADRIAASVRTDDLHVRACECEFVVPSQTGTLITIAIRATSRLKTTTTADSKYC